MGSEPNVHVVASIVADSVITLVSPNWAVDKNLGARTNKLNAPIAKPTEIPMVDRILCFWIIPIDDTIKKIKILDKRLKNCNQSDCFTGIYLFEKEMC